MRFKDLLTVPPFQQFKKLSIKKHFYLCRTISVVHLLVSVFGNAIYIYVAFFYGHIFPNSSDFCQYHMST